MATDCFSGFILVSFHKTRQYSCQILVIEQPFMDYLGKSAAALDGKRVQCKVSIIHYFHLKLDLF